MFVGGGGGNHRFDGGLSHVISYKRWVFRMSEAPLYKRLRRFDFMIEALIRTATSSLTYRDLIFLRRDFCETRGTFVEVERP